MPNKTKFKNKTMEIPQKATEKEVPKPKAPETSSRKPSDAPEKADPAVQKHLDQLEKESLSEIGDISNEEFTELKEKMPELIEHLNPTAAEYLKNLQPRLDQTLQKVEAARAKKLTAEGVDLVIEFLENEEKNLESHADPQFKELMLGYISQALDLVKLDEEMSKVSKWELTSTALDFIPIVGSGKMMYEATSGHTLAGKEMSTLDRVCTAGCSIAFLVADGVSLLTAPETVGGSVVAEEAIKAGVIGAVKSAPKAAKVASSLQRLAALIRKTTSMRKTAKTLFRIGSIMKKNPQVTKYIFKQLSKRHEAHSEAVNDTATRYRQLRPKLNS